MFGAKHIAKSRFVFMALPLAFALAACNGNNNAAYIGDPEKAFLNAKSYFEDNQSSDYGYPSEVASLSVGRVDLGRKLFHDKRLSKFGDFACATCHNPKSSFTQNDRAMPKGATAQNGGRNAPSLYDIALNASFNHDGSAGSITQQAFGPLTNVNEMANTSVEEVALRIATYEDYTKFFQYAYNGEISPRTVTGALAAYQTTILTGPNALDKWLKSGRKRGLNLKEVAGFNLFVGKAGCSSCHTISGSSPRLTDNKFHDTGYRSIGREEADEGRYRVTGVSSDKYAFRTPSLRNVALTAPYMHDGGLKTLPQVISFFNDNQNLGLTASERAALHLFLKALTSKRRPTK